MFASVCTVIFGFVYGEFFGFEPYHPLISRAHEMGLLMSIAILIGMTHILAGLLIGFYNVYKRHGLKHAVMEKFGWILLYPLILKLFVVLGILSGGIASFADSILPGWLILSVLAAIGVVFIIMSEGITGAVELPGIFGNILSYSRLMAIALASVSLAMVINDGAKALAGMGIIGIVGAILIFTIGHAINIALGIIGPFLHSLRLEYVEFFTKFFKGGAKRYAPFGYGG